MRRGKWKANGGEIGKKRMGVDLIKNYMSVDKCFIFDQGSIRHFLE